jgi:hypothetical protein
MAPVPAIGAAALKIAIMNGTSTISVTTATMASTAPYLNEESPALCINSNGRGFRLIGSDIVMIQVITDRPNTGRLAFQCAYFVKSRSCAFALTSWHGKQVSCWASSIGSPLMNRPNPQPPVAAYFFESLTMI